VRTPYSAIVSPPYQKPRAPSGKEMTAAEENLFLRVATVSCSMYISEALKAKEGTILNIIQKDGITEGLANRGKLGMVKLDDLVFGVTIKDARFRFGHLDYLIEPLNGSGEQWVENHRVEIKA
jgi:hypothetical protein